jgi:hypothetical protein
MAVLRSAITGIVPAGLKADIQKAISEIIKTKTAHLRTFIAYCVPEKPLAGAACSYSGTHHSFRLTKKMRIAYLFAYRCIPDFKSWRVSVIP